MTAQCCICQGHMVPVRPYVFKSKFFRDIYRDRNVYVCQSCGLGQADLSLIDDDELSLYYRDKYRAVAGIAMNENGVETPHLRARGKALAGLLERYRGTQPVRRVFEVGAGYGANLLAVGARFPDVKLYTDEIDASIDRPAAIGTATLSDGPYDAIVMSHVLEHFIDPAGALARSASALGEGGLLVVEVPNDDPRSVGVAGFDEPHVLFFNEDTLRQTAGKVPELKLLEIFTAGPSRQGKRQLRHMLRDLASWLPAGIRKRLKATLRKGEMDFSTPTVDGIYLRAIFRKAV